jgi:hypothetical protein
MTDIPIHDWRDTDYYNNLKNETNLTRWAWEFLRRNPEYQAEYQRFSEFPDCDETGNSKIGKWRGTVCQGACFYVDAFHYTNPPAYLGETLEQYNTRCPDGEIMPYAWYLERKYYLSPGSLPNPAIEFYSQPVGFSDMNDNSIFGYEFPPWEIDVYPDFEHLDDLPELLEERKHDFLERMKSYGRQQSAVILAFDIRQPIDKQIDEAKRLLIDRKVEYKKYENIEDEPFTKSPSLVIRMFPDYLRVLDAIPLEVTNTEIGRVIWKQENTDSHNVTSKLLNNIESAIRWRDFDYWKICFLKKNTPPKIITPS